MLNSEFASRIAAEAAPSSPSEGNRGGLSILTDQQSASDEDEESEASDSNSSAVSLVAQKVQFDVSAPRQQNDDNDMPDDSEADSTANTNQHIFKAHERRTRFFKE